ncbi:MAG: RNA polymerase subunit sigma-24 [Alphaproteobacteria bacterium]|nr:RNA polymerase subunit sigma-24 [Alphaproteobacteria bacterium]
MSQDLDADLYAHLRRLAGRLGGGEGTLNPTSLVHEAWEKLARNDAAWNDRTHFIALSARAMRQILVDRARGRGRAKRGGGRHRTTLSGIADDAAPLDLLALDEALERLGEVDAEAADVLVLRTFGGLTLDEVAVELGRSKRTVSTRWQFGRAFVLSELG